MTISTDVGSARRRARLSLLAVSTILSSGFAASAHAQTAPPPYVDVDQNGVDLVSGDFVTTITEGSIGSGEGAVALTRTRSGPTYWVDNWSGGLLFQTVAGVTKAYAIFGATSDVFSLSGSTYTSTKGDGATLVANTVGTLQGYLYTAADGTKIQFRSNGSGGLAAGYPVVGFACADYSSTSCSIPVSITKPDGMVFTLNWTFVTKCTSGSGPTCVGGEAYYRFAGVNDSAGYGFTVNYLTNSAGNFSVPQADWYKKTSVTFANAQNPPSPAPTVTYPTPSAGYPDFNDPAGRSWHFGGGDQTVLTSIQRPGDSAPSTSITYAGTAPGYVSAITINGVTTHYNRVVSGSTATTTITDAQGHQTTVVADLSKGRVTQITDPLGHVTTYTIDDDGRVADVTAPEGNKVQYTYDGRGNVTTTTRKAKPSSGLSDIVTSANYDATCSNVVTCNSPHWARDANLNQTDYTYDSTTGQLLTVTAPAPTSGANRPQTRYSYTATGGVSMLTGVSMCQTGTAPGCIGTADEVKTTVGYNSNLLPNTVSVAAGDASVSATNAYGYDASGNLLTVDGPLAGTDDTTTYRYDADRERVGVISADPDGAGTMKRRAIKTTYNLNGQPTVTELGTVTGTTDADWAAFVSKQQLTSTYDANARKTEDTLTAGGMTYGVSQYSYDSLGRLDCSAVRMNSALWGSLPTSACAVQTAGNAGPDRITKTGYDELGRVASVTTGYGVSGTQSTDVTNSYTGNGKIATQTDAENNKTTYIYDGFDRLSQTEFPGPTQGSGTSSATDYEQLGYDPNGNVISRRLRDATSIAYSYDHLNRLTLKDLPGSEPDVTYSYDNLGRPTGGSQTGNVLTFGYDALSRLVTQTSPVETLISTYDAAGRRTKLAWNDGFYVIYDYDTLGEMTKVRENGATSGIGVLATYTYDDLGNRTNVTNGNGTTSSWTPDPVSRLASLVHDMSGNTNDVTRTFAYNPASGIASTTSSNDTYAWSGAVNVNRNYTTNGLNQYTASGGSTLGYDTRGNLTSSPPNTYTYSSENLLTTGPSSTSLAYDPLLRLYQVTQGSTTTRFGYDGLELAGEYNSAGTLLRRYVFGPGIDEPIVWYEGSGTTDRRWLHADERDSVIAVTNASGTSIATNSYDEYGIPGSGNIGRFQYTGQEWLPELGMYYYKARMYSPSLGRFMQTDPIGYGDGMNWYNYVGNDPINFVDPTGSTCYYIETSNEVYKVFSDGHIEDAGKQVGSEVKTLRCFSDNGGSGPSTTSRGGSGRPQNVNDIVVTGHRPHKYVLPFLSPCPASAVFGYFMQAGHSAPGAPAAREGFTPRIVLTGGNPISQYVNSSTGTIVNTTLPGHRYYPGTVTIQVTPLSAQTSTIVITGEGTGAHPEENVILGEAWFGGTGAGAAAPEVCGK